MITADLIAGAPLAEHAATFAAYNDPPQHKPTVTIRPMRPEDEPRVRELCATLPEMDMARERPPGYHLVRHTLVAEEDGRIVGHTSWSQQPGFTAWDETVVAASHRGRGIGRQLMNARAERTPGFVIGACHDENEPMVHLLMSMGFHACQRVGTMMMYTRPHFNKEQS